MSNWRKVPATFWHLLLVTFLSLPLIMPLLRWTAVPCTHDGHLHVHRVAAMRHAWQNGVHFSRWLPDLAFGYGYPFFIYREPTPLYAILWTHLLGFPLPAASNLFYAFCILAAGWFMFLWVKDVAGPRAGIVSAVAYMAAPYVLLDALVRGNAPESLALPLLPLLLWIGRRWIIQGSLVTFLLSVFSLAFLSLSHNISLLIFTPVLMLYLIAVGWLHQLAWRPLLLRLLLLFGLGLGMTFFYTGGALLEMDQVTLNQSTATRNNDFHFNFASWTEILAPVAAEDPNLLNPPLPIRLGWVPAALALLGASTLLWKKPGREQRWHVVMMLVATAVFLFMSLPVSLPIWEALPLIDFVQFPWRFIGRAALPVAFLAGAPFARNEMAPERYTQGKGRLISKLALVGVVGLLLLEALPGLYPRTCEENSFPTIVNVHNYERASGLVGIDPEGSYFPRTVRQRPDQSALEADYQIGAIPQRFDMSVLPDGATARADYRGLSATVTVESPSAFIARYFSFAFPGWVVTVDGQVVPVTPDDPDGLITFAIPAGEHIIDVRWQSTLLRTTLSLLSILALVGVGVTAVLLARHPAPHSGDQPRQSRPVAEFWFLVVLGFGLLAFKLMVVDSGQTPWRRSGEAPVANPAALTAGEVRFEGYSLSEDSVEAGETFDIDLAWSTLAPTLVEYQSNVWLSDSAGMLWSDKETQRPRLYEDAPPTWEREANQWAWDSREVRVLPGTPPGQYDLVLTLFDLATLQPVTFQDAQGVVVGPTAVIGQIAVDMPQGKVLAKPQYTSGETVPGSGLVLTGYNQDRKSMAPGELLLITLFWERAVGSLADTFALQLVSEEGQTVRTWEHPILRSDFDTKVWEQGQILRGQYALRLPAALESGTYQFMLQEEIPLGQLMIVAPQRNFAQPAMETAVQLPFADRATLAGYTVIQEDPPIVELVWRAEGAMDSSYHVFVHLVDVEGNIIAQSDGQPAEWTRPTTGWSPGEYIIDAHELSLSQGEPLENMSLRVGLYDPDTGERLPVGDADYAVLPLNQ
ncbi:MAG: hypothetical protein GWP61_01245 [Chloroflexi bacterium]|jgi:hypothetical protein|nr:hypothetical protein [Chloroflexota bacterium]